MGHRFGYFTAKRKAMSDLFIEQANNDQIVCYGRYINAEYVANEATNGWKVKLKNINCAIANDHFIDWIHVKTKTTKQNRKNLIFDITLSFAEHGFDGASKCLMAFNTKQDSLTVIQKAQNQKFRGIALKIKSWKHPKFGMKQKQIKKIKSLSSSSCHQSISSPVKNSKKRKRKRKRNRKRKNVQYAAPTIENLKALNHSSSIFTNSVCTHSSSSSSSCIQSIA